MRVKESSTRAPEHQHRARTCRHRRQDAAKMRVKESSTRAPEHQNWTKTCRHRRQHAAKMRVKESSTRAPAPAPGEDLHGTGDST